MADMCKLERARLVAARDALTRLINTDDATGHDDDMRVDEIKLVILKAAGPFASYIRPPEATEGDTMVVEAASWLALALWIAEKLAGRVVGEMGARIWSDLSGTMSVEDLYQAAIADIERLLVAAFAQHDLDEAIDAARRASDAIDDYRTAPAHRLDTLANAEAWSRTALATVSSPRHTVAGYGAFLIAGGLHMAILQERLNQFRDPAEVTVIRNNMGRLSEHLRRAEPLCRAHVSEGFHTFVVPGATIGRNRPNHYNAIWWYHRDPFYGPLVRVEDGIAQDRHQRAHDEATRLGREAFAVHKTREIATLDNMLNEGKRIESLWKQAADNARVPD